MARRGDRVVSYEAQLWRCDRCGDPVTGTSPLEFVDAQLMRAKDRDVALSGFEARRSCPEAELHPQIYPATPRIPLGLQPCQERIDVRLMDLSFKQRQPPAAHRHPGLPVRVRAVAVDTLEVPEQLYGSGRQLGHARSGV